MKKRSFRSRMAIFMAIAMLFTMTPTVFAATWNYDGLLPEWTENQDYSLNSPVPETLSELKQDVDVTDPASVAAYWVWAVNRLVYDYDDGMAMMKYLFADIEVFGTGYYEGGMSCQAGWDSYFNDRLTTPYYSWLPRAYFEGADAENGFQPDQPLTVALNYNRTSTDSLNAQSLEQMGRLNVAYDVYSNAAGNRVTIHVSKFANTDRWYVTNGAASNTLFYDQNGALSDAEQKLAQNTVFVDSERNYQNITTDEPITNIPGNTPSYENWDDNWDDDWDDDRDDDWDNNWNTDPTPAWKSSREDIWPDPAGHRYAPMVSKLPFTDVNKNDYFAEPVAWAYAKGITSGATATTFGTDDTCTRGQVVSFLWRAAGKPEMSVADNPFKDVSPKDYYYEAVLWAANNKIVTGTSANTFSPNDTCSSAHIMTFLYRFCGNEGGWYQPAKNWGISCGLNFDTGLKIDPNEPCPRSAVLTYMYRSLPHE